MKILRIIIGTLFAITGIEMMRLGVRWAGKDFQDELRKRL
jgi:hypothetical protein